MNEKKKKIKKEKENSPPKAPPFSLTDQPGGVLTILGALTNNIAYRYESEKKVLINRQGGEKPARIWTRKQEYCVLTEIKVFHSKVGRCCCFVSVRTYNSTQLPTALYPL